MILSKMRVLQFLTVVLFIGNVSTIHTSAQTGNEWAVKMGLSEMKRFPEAWMVDFGKTPQWSYTQGLVSLSFLRLWEKTKEAKYFEYAKGYADKLIDAAGTISSYSLKEYNLDRINSGKILFQLYDQTNDRRYEKAIQTLRTQLKSHPRTSDGGFWHKKVYTSQMWLDGLYMASPFLAQYGSVYNDTSAINETIGQILAIHKHNFDPKTGLYYHAWDESKQQAWANKETGCSPNFWGRALGWYYMAMVDALEFIPEDHPKRKEVISILQHFTSSISNYQDQQSGAWYQVIDQGNRNGNYLESSASCMFVYGMLKSIRKGYIDKANISAARKGYQGLIKTFIRENPDETISITKGCAVAGLGGNPYRSGTFDYYISEPIRDDDPKAVGTFMMVSLEYSMVMN